MNNSISKAAAIATFSLLLAISNFSQIHNEHQLPPIPNEEQITEMINDMAVSLDLSPEQKVKFLELHKAHFEELKSKHEINKKEIERKRIEMEKERLAFENELKSFLNDNQKVKFDILSKKKHHRPKDMIEGSPKRAHEKEMK